MENSIRNDLVEWFRAFVIALAAVLILKFLFFDVVPISNISMEPSIYANDRVFLNIIGYRLERPQRGDVIIFTPPIDENSYYIKRVIAVPGDRLVVEDGMVYVNDVLLDETYLPQGAETAGDLDITIQEGTVFVMGDNRENSEDSRDFGPIEISSIRGHALFKVYPFSRIGKL